MNNDAMPAAQGPEAEFFAGLDRGRFRIQQCEACALHVFYPRVLCPHCGSERLSWKEASGRGEVYSCSVILGKPGTGTDYNVVLVDLDEGVRMMSRIEGVDPHAIRIGMRVRGKVELREGRGRVVFVPEDQA